MKREKIYITKSAKETEKLGEKIGKKLIGEEILALSGDLGGGKTTFVRGLARGLSCKCIPKSPSFVLLNIYNCRDNLKLAHFDLYRLEGKNDLDSVGMNDYLGKNNTISVIEWAEKAKRRIAKDAIWIKFKHIAKDKRKVRIRY